MLYFAAPQRAGVGAPGDAGALPQPLLLLPYWLCARSKRVLERLALAKVQRVAGGDRLGRPKLNRVASRVVDHTRRGEGRPDYHIDPCALTARARCAAPRLAPRHS
jgi:hypothetical protein